MKVLKTTDNLDGVCVADFNANVKVLLDMGATNIHLSTDEGTYPVLKYLMDETKEEEEKRLRLANEHAASCAVYRRRQYEKLKQEFGDSK